MLLSHHQHQHPPSSALNGNSLSDFTPVTFPNRTIFFIDTNSNFGTLFGGAGSYKKDTIPKTRVIFDVDKLKQSLEASIQNRMPFQIEHSKDKEVEKAQTECMESLSKLSTSELMTRLESNCQVVMSLVLETDENCFIEVRSCFALSRSEPSIDTVTQKLSRVPDGASFPKGNLLFSTFYGIYMRVTSRSQPRFRLKFDLLYYSSPTLSVSSSSSTVSTNTTTMAMMNALPIALQKIVSACPFTCITRKTGQNQRRKKEGGKTLRKYRNTRDQPDGEAGEDGVEENGEDYEDEDEEDEEKHQHGGATYPNLEKKIRRHEE